MWVRVGDNGLCTCKAHLQHTRTHMHSVNTIAVQVQYHGSTNPTHNHPTHSALAMHPYHQRNQAANAIPHQHHGLLLHKFINKVSHQCRPRFHSVLLYRFVRLTKAQQIQGVHLVPSCCQGWYVVPPVPGCGWCCLCSHPPCALDDHHKRPRRCAPIPAAHAKAMDQYDGLSTSCSLKLDGVSLPHPRLGRWELLR